MFGITDLLLMIYIAGLDFFTYTPDYVKGGYEPGNPVYPGCYELHNFAKEPAQVPIFNVPGHPVTGWKRSPEYVFFDGWGNVPRQDQVEFITPMHNFYKNQKAYDE